MKRLLISIVAFAFILAPCVVMGQQLSPLSNMVTIMSGVTMARNGTSTYIIDLNSPQLGYRPTGEFSLQFSGVSPLAGSVVTGTTINATWQGSNKLPSGVTQVGLIPSSQTPTTKLASTTIVSGLNVLSGNSEYPYGFFYIDTVRYIIISITNGVYEAIVTGYVKVD